MLSFAEENYLKAIYHLSQGESQDVSTNDISEMLKTKPASVTDMIKKLDQKDLITYKKYQGVNVSKKGKILALQIIRKHRLWEVFLVEKLKFNWHEVHEVAEQLEHIKSPLMVQRLDEFLGYPKYDPHGDPIPDKDGEFTEKPKLPLSDLEVGFKGVVVAVKDSGSSFLQYLDKIGMHLGARVHILEKEDFDGSIKVRVDEEVEIFMSQVVIENILVTD